MNDRLSELKGERNEQPIDTRDVELGHVQESKDTGEFMKEVFDRVDAVKVRFWVVLCGQIQD